MKHEIILKKLNHCLGHGKNLPEELGKFLSALSETFQKEDGDFSLIENAVNELSEEVQKKNSRIDWFSKFPDENPNPVLRISKEGILKYANPSSQLLLSFSKMEMNKDVPQYWKNIVKIALAQNQNETIELEVDQKFYSFTVTPVEHENYVNVYGYDITGRKLAENYLLDQNNILGSLAADKDLQTILNQLCLYVEKYTDGLKSSILVADKSGKYLHYGAAPSLPEKYIEKTRKVHIGNNNGSCGSAAYFKRTIIAEDISKDPRWDKYKEVPLSHGLKSCWSTPVMDTEGQVLGTFALYYHKSRKPLQAELELIKSSANIAALAINKDRAKAELKSYATELERSNKELTDFAYIASHDLQEPLRKISIFSDRVLETKNSFNDNQRGYLERMGKAAGRMRALIEDLLKLSRVTTAGKPFQKVDLGQIVVEVVEDLEAKLEETNGEIKIGELPNIEADPFQMRQLFQNLLENALKYHKEDTPPKVEIDSSYKTQEGWTINIKDNGIGLNDEKFSERIFAPLERLHGNSTYEGTGIGLAICKKIITRHRGSIFVKSREGEGATFSFILPKKQPGNGMG